MYALLQGCITTDSRSKQKAVVALSNYCPFVAFKMQIADSAAENQLTLCISSIDRSIDSSLNAVQCVAR
jgi:hypothetical protein